MNLLDQIIKAITESDEKTTQKQKKKHVLSYELRNDALKSWVSKELNGYDRDDPDLPEYRRISAPAKGMFIGAFRAIDAQPIPSAMLKEEHRHFAETAVLTQPLAAYEGAEISKGAVIPWPANLVGLYQSSFFDGELALNRAWQDVPGSVLV